MKKPIALFLITGFLGAGKTTFLKGLLEDDRGRKIGVLVNEFGAVGIDGTLVKKKDIEMVEINSGSIFCSCLKQGFVKTLLAFSETDIDVLFIESSGMADPSNFRRLLDGIIGRTKRPFRYHGAAVLIDPVTFLKYEKILTAIRNQIAAGRLIILNKTDLVNREILDEVRHKVLEIRPDACLYETTYGKVPAGFLEEKTADRSVSKESTNTPQSRFMTYSLETKEVSEREAVNSFFEAMQPYLLRLKGFVRTGDGWLYADEASGILTERTMPDEETEGLEKTQIVLIGKGPQEFEDTVRKKWRDFCGTKIELFQ